MAVRITATSTARGGAGGAARLMVEFLLSRYSIAERERGRGRTGDVSMPTLPRAQDSHSFSSARTGTMFAWRSLALLLSLAMALFLRASCGAADDGQAARPVTLKKGDRILFFGDSLTYLAGKEEPKK